MKQLRHLLDFVRPVQLLLALLTYGLGLGIARYLGTSLQLEPQLLGGAVILLLVAASNLLVEYFRPWNEPLVPESSELQLTPAEREQLRSSILMFGAAFLVAAGMLVFVLQRDGFLRLDSALLLVVFTLLALTNAVPPVRLSARGLGELVNAYLLASLTPTLAFLLQTNNFHRLLTLFTFPLFLIALACFLALDFPAYADDLKYDRRSLLTALSWEQAVPLHNVLLISAYFFLSVCPFLGVTFDLVWPVLLTLPLAVYQAFALLSIANGAKPVWRAFRVTAWASFGLAAYLLALTFWLR